MDFYGDIQKCVKLHNVTILVSDFCKCLYYISSKARGSYSDLSPDLYPYLVYASSKGSDESLCIYEQLPELLLLADAKSTGNSGIGQYEMI